MPTRRPLPPLNALRAFEATARNASFSKAAEELHVTPAALSHQIRGLEDLLGLKLFHRRARAIELTDAARLIYPGIRTGFENLRAAVEQLDRARQDRILVVSASPGLTAKWLVPRIYRFLAQHPDIDTRISSGTAYANFTTDGVDVGIRLSSGVHPELHVEKLADEWMLPLCSPRLLDGEQPLRSAHDLPRFPLIQIDLPGLVPTWDDWLRAVGIEGIDTTRGLRLNVADHALDAASEGTGVVLGYKLVASHDIASGAAGLAVRAGAAAARPLLPFRLRPRAGAASRRQGLPRLAVRRDRRDASPSCRRGRRCTVARTQQRPSASSRRCYRPGADLLRRSGARGGQRAHVSDRGHSGRRHRQGGDRGGRRGARRLRQARRRLRASRSITSTGARSTTRRHGALMPENGRDQIKGHDAILFGSAGAPDVPDHITLWGLRLAICQPFDQYANVRPTRILPGITSPLRGVAGPELDWVIVRENSEGEYAGVGGRVHRGLPEEVATDVSMFTRAGVERIMRFAFALAPLAPAQAPDRRHQVQRPAPRHGDVGRDRRRGRGASSPTSPGTRCWSTP